MSHSVMWAGFVNNLWTILIRLYKCYVRGYVLRFKFSLQLSYYVDHLLLSADKTTPGLKRIMDYNSRAPYNAFQIKLLFVFY